MLAFIYIICGFFTGDAEYRLIMKIRKKEGTLAERFFMDFAFGLTTVTWLSFFLAQMLSPFVSRTTGDGPLFVADIIIIIAAGAAAAAAFVRKPAPVKTAMPQKREMVLFAAVLAFCTVTSFSYVHCTKDSIVVSCMCDGDFSAHLPIMRSFVNTANFPPQYAPFGHTDMRYHFLYDFMAGNLELLGMRTDLAFNIPSILAQTGIAMMTVQIIARLGGSFAARVIGALMTLFHSGTILIAFLTDGEIRALPKMEGVIRAINEEHGIWYENTFLNQHHFVFTVLVGLLAAYLMLDIAEDECKKPFALGAACGVILGAAGFWNGAVVISYLLVLAVFALFSRKKAPYILTALIAVSLVLLQSRLFCPDAAILKPHIALWWMAADKSLPGGLLYVMKMFGIFPVMLALCAVFLKKRTQRAFTFAAIALFAFPLFVSMTDYLYLNHKYFTISFLTGAVCVPLLTDRIRRRFLVPVLAVCLTATGVMETALIVAVNLVQPEMNVIARNSDIENWLKANCSEKDLILQSSMYGNEVYAAGIPMYLTDPGLPFQIGYPDDRYEKALRIMNEKDPETVRQMIREEGITLIVYSYDDYMGEPITDKYLKDIYPLIYDDGWLRVYKCT